MSKKPKPTPKELEAREPKKFLASIRTLPIDGRRTPPKPTLDQYDRWSS